MKKYTRYSLIVIYIATMILASLWTTPSFARQNGESKYDFAYFSTSSGKSAINLIDMTNNGHLETFPVDTPQDMSVHQAIASPTGEWIALVLWSGTGESHQDLIRLFNVVSKETQDLSEMNGELAFFVTPTWSPNSQYIAFDMLQAQSGITTYIYSITNRKLLPIITNSDHYNHFAWSSDSSQIAVEQGQCQSDADCHVKIETFDAATGSLKLSFDGSKLSGYASEQSICNLNWSPDMQYISFAAVCDGTTWLAALEETYVWDITTNKVVRLTNYTVDMAKDKSLAYFTARYQTIWYDAQTLVISARWNDNLHPNDNTQIVVYDLAKGTSNVISSDPLFEFTITPISRQIALTQYSTLTPKGTDLPPLDGHIVTLTNDSSTFKLNTVVDVTGCKFAWSPDGAYLFYNKYTGPDCVIRADKFAFLDKSNNEVKLTLPAEEGDVTPIGWVVSPPSSAAK